MELTVFKTDNLDQLFLLDFILFQSFLFVADEPCLSTDHSNTLPNAVRSLESFFRFHVLQEMESFLLVPVLCFTEIGSVALYGHDR
jgi:hypothetical protein